MIAARARRRARPVVDGVIGVGANQRRVSSVVRLSKGDDRVWRGPVLDPVDESIEQVSTVDETRIGEAGIAAAMAVPRIEEGLIEVLRPRDTVFLEQADILVPRAERHDERISRTAIVDQLLEVDAVGRCRHYETGRGRLGVGELAIGTLEVDADNWWW
jgi:hypothetical protein